MRITTKGCYGIRAMLELARSHGHPPLLMQTIAERQGLSRKYLHALLTALREAGLVRSVRGAGGGFLLARHPARIGLHEVLRALEGPLTMTDCAHSPTVCARSGACPVTGLWRELGATMEHLLENITLEMLLRREGRQEQQAPMYHI